eukprot:341725-Hanusia_phi.AAC.2
MKKAREESEGRISCLKNKLRDMKFERESLRKEVQRLKDVEVESEMHRARSDLLEGEKMNLTARLQQMEQELETQKTLERKQQEELDAIRGDLNVCLTGTRAARSTRFDQGNGGEVARKRKNECEKTTSDHVDNLTDATSRSAIARSSSKFNRRVKSQSRRIRS